MIRTHDDPKVQAILDSAWQAFSAYGFRKTSMDDIARGAGMSRTALYLHFRNKEAIFTALVETYYALAADGISAALDGPGDLGARLEGAFAAHGGPVMEAMMNSPHGLELFETGMSVAADAIEAGEGALRAVYASWLQQESAAGRVHLTGEAGELARVFCAALKGIKHTADSYRQYRSGVSQLAAVMGRALAPR
ncbi:TetR/AcrR family transcriptional regulator [Roseobacteraceae bacterium NS-SX3]